MIGSCHSDAVKDFLKLAQLRSNRPDVDFLGKLMRAFLRFPYENLTKIIRLNEESDPDARLRMPDVIMGDHIDLGAGGTCFSLTFFFQNILEQLGYSCTPVMCDRSYGSDTHCALIATVVDQRYLIDPGYLLQHPLAIPKRGTTSQETPFNRVHLTRLGHTSQLLLSTDQGGKSNIRYRLKDRSVDHAEFRQRWIESFSWAQMRHLCITRLGENGHIFMRDSHIRHSTAERRSQEKLSRNVRQIVHETFNIDESLVEHARSYL